MFNLFRKNKKGKQKEVIPDSKQSIKFQDLKIQNIEISTRDIGSDIVLIIKELKSGTEIAMDNELCKVISIILNEFSETKNLNAIIKTIENEE